jgi:hypothetical protein
MYIGRVLENAPLDMRDFDTTALARVARAHLAKTEGARRRKILENFIEHAEAEAAGEYERLMASCSKKRQSYTMYGAPGGEHLPQSYAELEKHYYALIAANLYLIHFECEKLAVGDDVLYVEGLVHQLYPGGLVEPIFGFAVDDPDAVYQLTKRTALTFVFDEDGLGAGEHAYADGPTTPDDLTRVPPELVPKAFHENPLASSA